MIDLFVWLALGLIVLLAGGRWMDRGARQQRFLRILGGGWGFLFLGVVLGPMASGIVSEDRLATAQPILLLLLAWCGAVVGLQCQWALIRAIPRPLWRWIAADFFLCLLGGAVAATALSGAWQQEPSAAGQLVLAGTAASIAIGWNPESRSLGIRSNQASLKLARFVQVGAGALAIGSVLVSSLSLQIAHLDSSGVAVMAPSAGLWALALEAAAVAAVALVAVAIVRDSREDDARTTLVVVGALALLAGVAVSCGGSGLFSGLLIGATIAASRTRASTLAAFISRGEPVVAAGLFLFAGLLLRVPAEPVVCLWLVIAAVVIALARDILKPLVMALALGADAPAQLHSLPASRAVVRQAPLVIVVLLAFSVQDRSGLASELLTLGTLVALGSIALTALRPPQDDLKDDRA
ncbi:MAG: hypothetical protein EXS03_03680 [Phycisphaerales bacterium]|nr:hypothetical protein [Phycisphaerales bacterium]